MYQQDSKDNPVATIRDLLRREENAERALHQAIARARLEVVEEHPRAHALAMHAYVERTPRVIRARRVLAEARIERKLAEHQLRPSR